MLLRARCLLPVAAPPVDDGAVRVRGNRIVEVGRFRDLAGEDSEPASDLGDVVLLPGLVNAHCHLDYTHMAGRIARPRHFVEWIEAIIAYKAGWDYSDYADSWVTGARQLLAGGVTTVADMEAVPELIPEVWAATPLRVHSFLELLNVRPRTAPAEQVAAAVNRLLAHPNPRGGGGLSPHALYSASPELLAAARAATTRHAWPLSLHVAESGAEAAMFQNADGPMFDWLRRNQRDMSDCGQTSPVALLERLGLLGRELIAVHCNHLADDDLARLGRAGCTVVHCPSSHAYFGHAEFRARELAAAGVNLCLGTDSLASGETRGGRAPVLDLRGELRRFAEGHPGFAPEQMIEMVTGNGARALGRGHELGGLQPGFLADLVAFHFTGTIDEAAEQIIHGAGPAAAVMIDGRWEIAPVSRAI